MEHSVSVSEAEGVCAFESSDIQRKASDGSESD